MKIALAQINPVVGDISGNTHQIRQAIGQAQDLQVQLVVFPELSIIGYPPKDLLLKRAVINQCVDAVDALAQACTGIAAIIGYPCPTGQPKGRPLHNVSALCFDGRLKHRYVKSLLPTHDVFDEHRYFEPGPPADVASALGTKIGVSICEDLWNDQHVVDHQMYHSDPIQRLANAGAELLINCSASPFAVHKDAFRTRLLTSAAKRHGLPMLFCNQVGGNDELVFDGSSCVVAGGGEVIARAKSFEPDLLIADVPIGGQRATPTCNRIEKPLEETESVFHALALGLRDYCRKCGFGSAILGLSGGIDSAVTAALAVAALGPKQVRGVAMPSRYSSHGSVTDAAELARRLGIRLDVVPINQAHHVFEQMLEPPLEGKPSGTTAENLQARIRGVVLMAMSNQQGALLVTTGNKSELAVGYCTLYGDMAGGLAVLSDVPKTMVNQLARWINESSRSPLRQQFRCPVIPEPILTKPPSAELRPDQTDQDSLPPYGLLDQIIERYVELDQPIQQIVDELAQQADRPHADTIRQVVGLIDQNEYKRKQAAPGIKITSRAFGFGRRMPIAQCWNHDE